MEDLRAAWTLDPAVAFLNHGSFGACPEPVLRAQAEWRARMEREPVLFLDREIDGLLAGARARAARFLRADPDGLVFVPNTTTAVSTVLASIPFADGDEIVTTDQVYGAVRGIIDRICERTGAQARVAPVHLPVSGASAVTGAIAGAITGATRLVIADHVTSPGALVYPIAEIVRHCRSRGVPVLVDAAHGPGMTEVDVDALGADYWCGNFHKWVCAPKGSAALWVTQEHRAGFRPLVTSHPHLETVHQRFDWTGTFDPTAWLAVPAAIDFFDGAGWDRVRARNVEMAERGRAIVAHAIGAPRIAPPLSLIHI